MQKVKNAKAVAPGKKRLFCGKDTKKTIELTILALPAMALIFAFHYAAMPGLVLAFKNYNYRDGIWRSPFNGFENFRFIFSSDISLAALRNTVLYNFVFIILGLVTGIALAIALNNILNRGALKAYQTLIFIPYYLSWSIITYVVFGFLSGGNGILSNLSEQLTGTRIDFYGSPQYWPFIMVFLNFWKNFGYSTLLYYACILGIHQTYYEAATLDGASRWQKAWYITIPCLKPIILINLLNSLGKIFNSDFSMFWMVPMEKSMIKSATSTLDTYVYSALQGGTNLGMAAAAGLFQSCAGLVLVLLANWFIRNKFGRDKAMF